MPGLLPGKSHGWRSLVGYTVLGVVIACLIVISPTRLYHLFVSLTAVGLMQGTELVHKYLMDEWPSY